MIQSKHLSLLMRLAAGTILLTLWSCSSSQQDQQELQSQQEDGEEYQQQEGEQQAEEQSEDSYDDGSANTYESGGEETYESGSEDTGEVDTGNVIGTDEALTGNADVQSVDQVLQDLNSGEVDTEESLPPEQASVETPPTGSGAMVYYVPQDGVALYDQPSTSGSQVETLEKGDPLLIIVEGEWAQVPNRGYVQVSSLSQQAVSRTRTDPGWQ